MSEEKSIEQQLTERYTVKMGWHSVEIYPNYSGDICIKQEMPNMGQRDEEAIICIPRLYIDRIKAAIDLAVSDSHEN